MPIKTIDPATVRNWIENDEAVLVDVREPSEHQSHNIPCATLVPLAEVCKGRLPQYHGKKLVMHCQGGRRSMTACERLLQEDPELEVYNLEGGIAAWAQVCGR